MQRQQDGTGSPTWDAQGAFRVITSADARAWCNAIAKTLPKQFIQRDGSPYLIRYFLAGWNPITRIAGPSLFLHHFVASDAYTEVHSHPWAWGTSLILCGGYREHRCQPDGTPITRDYLPGDINALRADDKHRIELLEADCWTLFLAGNVTQAWGFESSC